MLPRLAEAEGCVSNLNGKAMTLEREKAKLQALIEEEEATRALLHRL